MKSCALLQLLPPAPKKAGLYKESVAAEFAATWARTPTAQLHSSKGSRRANMMHSE